MREVSLDKEADGLTKPVPKWVKASTADSRPGARLDGCNAFISRAKKRIVASTAAIAEAEEALQAAREHHLQLERELAEGQQRLAGLQKEMQDCQSLPENTKNHRS